MRIFSIFNVSFAAFGLYYFALRSSSRWNHWPGDPSLTDWIIFAGLSVVTIAIVVYLGYLGIRMIRGNESAIRDTALILLAEIVYFVAGVVIFWLLFPKPVIGVGFMGIARSALDPQVVTGYPVWGLISMLLLMGARKKSRQMSI